MRESPTSEQLLRWIRFGVDTHDRLFTAARDADGEVYNSIDAMLDVIQRTIEVLREHDLNRQASVLEILMDDHEVLASLCTAMDCYSELVVGALIDSEIISER